MCMDHKSSKAFSLEQSKYLQLQENADGEVILIIIKGNLNRRNRSISWGSALSKSPPEGSRNLSPLCKFWNWKLHGADKQYVYKCFFYYMLNYIAKNKLQITYL